MMTDFKEVWKPIRCYEGIYEVSNLGHVKRLKTFVEHNGVYGAKNKKLVKERILKPVYSRNYQYVKLCKKGIDTRYLVHRLVAETFIDNPNNKKEVNHIDGNKQNNRADNLEWCTHKENCKHRDDNNLRKAPKGEKHYLYGKHIKIGKFKSKNDIQFAE